MKLWATIQNRRRPLTVEKIGPNRYKINVEGIDHVLDACKVQEHTYHLLIDHRSYDVGVENLEPGEYTLHFYYGSVAVTIDEEEENEKRTRAILRGDVRIRAAMAGKVATILCRPGEFAKEEQPLIIMEAMKMQNELRAPISGQIIDIYVQEGQPVKAGQPLLLLSAEPALNLPENRNE